MIKALNINEVSKCNLCALLGKEHVPSDGSVGAKLMIIGQSPGAEEVKQGKPFVGPSGELLDFMLDEAGLDRSECYIANCLKCRPPGNRPGSAIETSNCWNTWLRDEIKSVDPKLILLLGRDAHKTVIGNRVEFGHMNELSNKKRHFLMSYHPSYFLRRGEIEAFVRVGVRVKALLDQLPETSV